MACWRGSGRKAGTSPEGEVADGELVRVNGRQMKAFKPSQDLKQFPQKLVQADVAERTRLLVGLHERFWHAGPQDMLRLLNAMLLPRDLVILG